VGLQSVFTSHQGYFADVDHKKFFSKAQTPSYQYLLFLLLYLLLIAITLIILQVNTRALLQFCQLVTVRASPPRKLKDVFAMTFLLFVTHPIPPKHGKTLHNQVSCLSVSAPRVFTLRRFRCPLHHISRLLFPLLNAGWVLDSRTAHHLHIQQQRRGREGGAFQYPDQLQPAAVAGGAWQWVQARA